MNHTMMFRYDATIRQGLEAIKARDGVPYHEQVRRAVLMWIAAKDVPPVEEAAVDPQAARAIRPLGGGGSR